jgi:hypothetical protein
MKIQCESQEEYDALKHKVMMVKVIVLDMKGHSPLINPSNFRGRKKTDFIEEVEKHLRMDLDELTILFNEVVNDTLLSGDADVSTFPIYENKTVV